MYGKIGNPSMYPSVKIPKKKKTAKHQALAGSTLKRTEGSAPVWGSEFTSKDAALQGGVGKIAARLNVKLCDLRDW
jgi:endo-1,4-beta-mannosidase